MIFSKDTDEKILLQFSTNYWSIQFQARHRVPPELLHKIASLNSLDVELYKYAQYVFQKQQARLTERTVKSVRQYLFLDLFNVNCALVLTFHLWWTVDFVLIIRYCEITCSLGYLVSF